jgi:hypothetical protein
MIRFFGRRSGGFSEASDVSRSLALGFRAVSLAITGKNIDMRRFEAPFNVWHECC